MVCPICDSVLEPYESLIISPASKGYSVYHVKWIGTAQEHILLHGEVGFDRLKFGKKEA